MRIRQAQGAESPAGLASAPGLPCAPFRLAVTILRWSRCALVTFRSRPRRIRRLCGIREVTEPVT